MLTSISLVDRQSHFLKDPKTSTLHNRYSCTATAHEDCSSLECEIKLQKPRISGRCRQGGKTMHIGEGSLYRMQIGGRG